MPADPDLGRLDRPLADTAGTPIYDKVAADLGWGGTEPTVTPAITRPSGKRRAKPTPKETS